MTEVTLTRSGVTFTFSQGEINQVTENINVGLDIIELPLAGPSDASLFDFTGTTKQLSIDGALFNDGTNKLSSGSAITILEQKQWLEALASGNQTANITFTSNYFSQSYNGSSFVSTTGAVSKINFVEVEGDPNRLKFTMAIEVGSL